MLPCSCYYKIFVLQVNTTAFILGRYEPSSLYNKQLKAPVYNCFPPIGRSKNHCRHPQCSPVQRCQRTRNQRSQWEGSTAEGCQHVPTFVGSGIGRLCSKVILTPEPNPCELFSICQEMNNWMGPVVKCYHECDASKVLVGF